MIKCLFVFFLIGSGIDLIIQIYKNNWSAVFWILISVIWLVTYYYYEYVN